MLSDLYDEHHELFRGTVREFIAREVAPHFARWEEDGIVDRALWTAAGKQGLLGMAVPEKYGGGGAPDFRYSAVIAEEFARSGTATPGGGFGVHNDVVGPYLLDLTTDDQKRRWLPGFCDGELVTAIAMSEPGAGSDLQGIRTTAVRDGGGWIVNGQKTFITNGIHADLVIVVAKTEPDAGAKGISLLVVERGMPGFERGRNLDKIGQHSQDTAEMFFSDVRVPGGNLLGQDGGGFVHLMENLPQERLSIAVAAVAAADTMLAQTLDYCRDREAFGRPIGSFQHNRFLLAEMATEIDIAQTYIDRCVRTLNAGELTVVDAAKAKWWTTELQKRVADTCLQLHGGYGYMREYPIARAWLDTRVQTIYGGTTEIMKEIIGRSLGF
ncbi:MAG: acyl-CoA dehydrogenase family protein [Streptomycetales bacterium]